MQLQFSLMLAMSQLSVQTAGSSSAVAVCTFNTLVISIRTNVFISTVQNSVSSEVLTAVRANMPLASWQNVCL